MTDKEQIKAVIKQYADKGKKIYRECYDNNESASLINYWDGYRDCAYNLLRELEDMQKEPQVKESAEIQHVKETCKENDDSLTQEPISEDLLKELKGIVNIRECVAQGVPVIKIARHFTNWQKQQMLKKAVDAVVKVDAGGYPYVDRTIELYDYDKDIPLAKKGDKVKILVIREE